MSDKRKTILEKLASGEIDANEAAVQLAALKATGAKTSASAATGGAKKKGSVSAEKPKPMDTDPIRPAVSHPPKAKKSRNAAQQLRIVAATSGATVLSLTVPMRLIKFGQQMGGRFGPTIDRGKLDDLNISIGNEDDFIRIYVE